MLEIELLVRSSLLLFLAFSQIIFGQNHPNSKIDSLLKIGIDNIVQQDYPKAKKNFDLLDGSFTNIPLGNIYLAATEIAQSVDYEEDISEEYVDSLLTLAKDKTDRLLESDSDNLWYKYYDALIYGYKAYYQSISGNLISAFADGVFSLQSFQKCLEIDNEFYEAFIALGSYNYWKSAQSKSLLWLPFIPDNREVGIEYLEKAIKSFSYNKYLAAYSLMWIYIDYDESEKAVELSLKMLNQYKNSRFFMWGLARAYQDIDNKKAIKIYNKLLESVETIPNRNQFNDIVLKHKLAMLYEEIGDIQMSLKLCNEILDFEFKSVKIKKRLLDRFQRTENLREFLEERLKK
jgi:tetratricopeptide (TPR) repeat protein